jgi:hypothetical protein
MSGKQFFIAIHKPQDWILSHNAILIMADKTVLGEKDHLIPMVIFLKA